MKKNWSTGKIVAAVAAVLLGILVLGAGFVGSVYYLSCFMIKVSEEELDYDDYDFDDYEWDEEEEEEEEKEEKEEEEKEDPEDDEYTYDDFLRDWEDEYDSSESEYYEFANDLREDLEYRITFEEFYEDEFEDCDSEGKMILEFSYPVINGNVTNLDAINEAIKGEVTLCKEYVAESAEYLSSDDTYHYIGDCYVTYMSEDILSIVYVEYGYLNDSYMESYVACFNVDIQTGMILQNSHLIEVDDAFSIDFRERCEKQNGEIEGLEYYSDQDITKHLSEDKSLIIFYTPLGMEIGFNYYDGWVTVTYPDYEKYQKQF